MCVDVLDGWLKERNKVYFLIDSIIENRKNQLFVETQLKELKNYLSLFDVCNDKKKILCIEHLKNLIKKWDCNNDIESLKRYIYITINKYESKESKVKLKKKK